MVNSFTEPTRKIGELPKDSISIREGTNKAGDYVWSCEYHDKDMDKLPETIVSVELDTPVFYAKPYGTLVTLQHVVNTLSLDLDMTQDNVLLTLTLDPNPNAVRDALHKYFTANAQDIEPVAAGN